MNIIKSPFVPLFPKGEIPYIPIFGKGVRGDSIEH
jgi:hypothetical protein